jgi:hypothetical protein
MIDRRQCSDRQWAAELNALQHTAKHATGSISLSTQQQQQQQQQRAAELNALHKAANHTTPAASVAEMRTLLWHSA